MYITVHISLCIHTYSVFVCWTIYGFTYIHAQECYALCSQSFCTTEKETEPDSELQKMLEPKVDEAEGVVGGVIAEALQAVVGEDFTVQEEEEGRESKVTGADEEKQAAAAQDEEKGVGNIWSWWLPLLAHQPLPFHDYYCVISFCNCIIIAT